MSEREIRTAIYEWVLSDTHLNGITTVQVEALVRRILPICLPTMRQTMTTGGDLSNSPR